MIGNPDRRAVMLAAFLHDIGKLLQRAGVQPQHPSFDVEYWLQELCPRKRNYYTYQHAMLTAYFIECYLPEPPNVNKDRIFRLASYHHRPHEDDWLEATVVLADWLASGLDRYDEFQEERDFRRVRLRPIFPIIRLDASWPSLEDIRWEYELQSLSLSESVVFPQELQSKDRREDFQSLWQDLQGALLAIPRHSFRAYFQGLYSLLYRTTWCVPSASNVFPDISLFDHSRVTSALAVCLYHFPEWIQERMLPLRIEALRLTEDIEPFLFVKGDIGGIQRYLYRVARTGIGGIAKRLRGRSFYIQLFSHQIARLLLYRLDLPVTHMLYCGGGHFLLVLPNTQEVRKALNRWIQDVEMYLWSKHLGELQFSVAWVSASPSRILNNFQSLMEQIEARLLDACSRRFLSIFRSGDGVESEKPYEHLRPCPSCQIQIVETDGVCEICKKQWDLGAHTRYQDGIVFSHARRIPSSEGVVVEWGTLGTTEVAPIDRLRESLQGDFLEVVQFNPSKDGFLPASPFFIVQQVPTAVEAIQVETERDDEENPEGRVGPNSLLSFTTIATWSEGDAKLGVLRIDADRMGEIFARGLPQRMRSLSRIATMSRQLQIFFEGWIGKICQTYTNEVWRQKVKKDSKILRDYSNFISGIFYTVYTGGDDLFLIGPWSEMLPLALRIVEAYRRFTGGNPHMTLSAGMVVCKPKYPIPSMARWAGEALEKSKQMGRNRVTVFGITVPWFSDDAPGLEELLRLADRWTEWIRTELVPRRFFHELLRIYDTVFSAGKVTSLEWIPRLLYRLYRNIRDPSVAEEMHHTLISRPNSLKLLSVIRIPATIALMRTRGG